MNSEGWLFDTFESPLMVHMGRCMDHLWSVMAFMWGSKGPCFWDLAKPYTIHSSPRLGTYLTRLIVGLCATYYIELLIAQILEVVAHIQI